MSDTMTVREAERQAQDLGFDSAWMTLVSTDGKETRVQWLDAYFGLVNLVVGHTNTDDLEKMGYRAKDLSLTK